MTKPSMALSELFEKGAEDDFLRQMVAALIRTVFARETDKKAGRQ